MPETLTSGSITKKEAIYGRLGIIWMKPQTKAQTHGRAGNVVCTPCNWGEEWGAREEQEGGVGGALMIYLFMHSRELCIQQRLTN